MFWRRSAAEQVGPFRTDLNWTMDYDLFLRLGKRWPGRFVDRWLARFRWYPASKSGAGFLPQFVEDLNVAKEHAAGKYKRSIFLHYFHNAKIVLMYYILWAFRRLFRR